MRLFFLIIGLLFFTPFLTLAHQPRIVADVEVTAVENPDISQAFYGALSGKADLFEFELPVSDDVLFSILVPAIEGIDKDVSGVLVSVDDDKVIATFKSEEAKWGEFFEEYAGDRYYQGPEKKIALTAGTYRFQVESPDNIGKYVFVIGEKELFPPDEIANAVVTVPKLKRDFFGKSYASSFEGISGKYLLLGFITILSIIVAIIVFIFKIVKNIK